MTDGWIKIYNADEEFKGQLIVSLLENNGLHPVMLDKKDDGFRIGHVEVYVAPEEVEQAKKAMEENQAD